MVGVLTARNQSNAAGTIKRFTARVVNANIGVYTVPADTKSRLTEIKGVLDAVGGDATYTLAIKRLSGVFDPLDLFVGAVSPNNVVNVSLVTLLPGEILTDIGDSGSTNGTMDISLSVEEFGL